MLFSLSAPPTARPNAASIAGVLSVAGLAMTTALAPPNGRSPSAFLNDIARDRRSASVIASPTVA
jgi:hypothetical protein